LVHVVYRPELLRFLGRERHVALDQRALVGLHRLAHRVGSVGGRGRGGVGRAGRTEGASECEDGGRSGAAHWLFLQVGSGLKRDMDDAIEGVCLPRSFSYTTPSWFTRKL